MWVYYLVHLLVITAYLRNRASFHPNTIKITNRIPLRQLTTVCLTTKNYHGVSSISPAACMPHQTLA